MAATKVAKDQTVDMKLEVVVLGVSDVDRAKAFYEKVGFRLDINVANENFRDEWWRCNALDGPELARPDR